MERDWIELQSDPLDVTAVNSFVSDASAGAIAVFLGTTRAERDTLGRQLVALHYEAYESMVLGQLTDLGRQARQRWPVIRLVMLHRTGSVALAEPSVAVAVSTPHRAEAFEACRWLIDALKREAAIWKKEIWDDGSGSWSGETRAQHGQH